MAIVDRVKWDGSADVLAWKFPQDNLSTLTQLIVNESQEAYVVKGGVYQGPFLAGRHTLSTENIPLLRGLIALPFGGETPFSAEVWYVNRSVNLDLPFGTREPIQLQDPKFQIMVPVRAFGQYGVRIEDGKRFLLKLVGTLSEFNASTLGAYFRGVMTSRIKTSIATAIIKNGRSVLEITTELDALSGMLRESLAADFSEYGVTLTQFNLMSVNVPEDDPAVVALKTALAKKTEMSLLGFTYQQERSFDVLEAAASNEGTAGGVMGAGLGMGMGVGIGVPMGQTMGQMAPAIQPMSIGCVSCQAMIPVGSAFCPQCGAGQKRLCGQCNAALPSGAKFCSACGTPA